MIEYTPSKADPDFFTDKGILDDTLYIFTKKEKCF